MIVFIDDETLEPEEQMEFEEEGYEQEDKGV